MIRFHPRTSGSFRSVFPVRSAASLIVCLTSATYGQTALISPNAQSAGHFGAAAAAVPDVTGDSIGDLLVGAPQENSTTGVFGAGRAYLFSGFGGALLFSLTSPTI